MRILIVDDDEGSLELLQMVLGRWGDCDTAQSGNEALFLARRALDQNKPYDLICLDIVMPGMSGQDVLTTIRQLESEKGLDFGYGSKIVMITGLNDSSNFFTSYAGKCNHYMTKPITKEKIDEILAIIGVAHK